MEGPGEDSSTDRVRATAGTDAGPRGPGTALPGHHRRTPPDGDYLHWEQGLLCSHLCTVPTAATALPQGAGPALSVLLCQHLAVQRDQTRGKFLPGARTLWSYSRQALASLQARALTQGVCHPPRVIYNLCGHLHFLKRTCCNEGRLGNASGLRPVKEGRCREENDL